MDNQFFLLMGLNTIITIVILFILFKIETNKIKLYIKKIDKKLENNKKYITDIESDNLNDLNDLNDLNKSNESNKFNNKNIMNDIDSYVDPINN